MKPDFFLGIETSGTTTGVALVRDRSVVFDETVGERVRHDQLLISLFDKALTCAGAHVHDLAGVGVSIGPGMFSSLRVGVSAAKGLAVALSIRVKGVSTLWALARSLPDPGRPVLAAIDARRSQVYAALYHQDEVLLEPGLFSYAELALLVGSRAGPHLCGVGSGVALCRAHFQSLGLVLEPGGVEYPRAGVIALEAARALARGAADGLEKLVPVYLRRTDAELARNGRRA